MPRFTPVLDLPILRVFGADADPITAVEARARLVFPDARVIVWEGDPQTFAFTYVGGDAEALLGYPAAQWVEDPAFWAERIIHPDDREDAVAYCALATGRAVDHVFEYRALPENGRIVWLKDYVRVVIGRRGIPVRLRGLMFDVTHEKRGAGAVGPRAALRLPSREELELAA